MKAVEMVEQDNAELIHEADLGLFDAAEDLEDVVQAGEDEIQRIMQECAQQGGDDCGQENDNG